MIKFRRLNVPLQKFFARYRAWLDFQHLCDCCDSVAIPSNDPDAVPLYEPWEMSEILKDPSPVIAIDLREGLREFGYLEQNLSQSRHYIIFSGSRPTAEFKPNLDCTVIYYDAILHDMLDLHLWSQSAYFYSDRHYEFVYPKPLNFVTFIGTPRGYRQTLASWLPQLHYQNFIFRMDRRDYGIAADHVDIVDFSQVDQDLPQWFENRAQHTAIPHYHIIGRVPTHMLNQAYFNLVLESDFDHEFINVTEKTVRSLLLGMPFVVAGACGHLEYLRGLGFQTYQDLWDESYDQEPVAHLRLRRVFDLCDQLGQFDWAAHRAQLEMIGRHNKANFLDLGHRLGREFEEFERIIKVYESRH
jgi:hypothetical protein